MRCFVRNIVYCCQYCKSTIGISKIVRRMKSVSLGNPTGFFVLNNLFYKHLYDLWSNCLKNYSNYNANIHILLKTFQERLKETFISWRKISKYIFIFADKYSSTIINPNSTRFRILSCGLLFIDQCDYHLSNLQILWIYTQWH